jgi:hypothetical protein
MERTHGNRIPNLLYQFKPESGRCHRRLTKKMEGAVFIFITVNGQSDQSVGMMMMLLLMMIVLLSFKTNLTR